MADPVTSASPDAANEIDVSQQLDDRSPILGPDCGDGVVERISQEWISGHDCRKRRKRLRSKRVLITTRTIQGSHLRIIGGRYWEVALRKAKH